VHRIPDCPALPEPERYDAGYLKIAEGDKFRVEKISSDTATSTVIVEEITD